MSSDLLEKYKRLLAKQPQIGDTYVIIDKKWLELWKRSVGIESTDETNIPDPGPIDFTKLAESSIAHNSMQIQLRADALEGNDYTFIPQELYNDLVEKYEKRGSEIIREAIPQGQFGTVIETFLVPLRFCKSRSSTSNTKQIYRSRRTKIEELKRDFCREYMMSLNGNYRLYSSIDGDGRYWEPIDEQPALRIEDVSLTKNAYITCESATLSSVYLAPSICSMNSFYTPGLCGLSNLGNTCFMNSALQCLSNVPQLTEYFRSSAYEQDINHNNPLGMKGDVATAYGKLITEMWSGRTSFCAPRDLKYNVARYAPQFSGFAQQDSQEFMSFLLDGLHEDLNRIKNKPYIEKKDDDGTLGDAEFAEMEWKYYEKRNKSVIQDIFHGQIKSIVKCLTCQTKARTFDPICFLSLPLPRKAELRTFKIMYVRLNGETKSYSVKFDEHGRMRGLIQEFCNRFQSKEKKLHERTPMDTDTTSNVNDTNQDESDEENEDDDDDKDFTKAIDYDGHLPRPDYILAAEVYNHRVYTQYGENHSLANILERDQIVFYEVPDSLKKENSDKILMPCIFREEYYSHQSFGLPIYLSVPRHHCTGKDIQEELQKRIGSVLPLPSIDSSDKPLYTATLLFSQAYNSSSKPLKSCFDDIIDFTRRSTTLVVDVTKSIVNEYNKQEQEKRMKKDNISSIYSDVQTHNEQKRAITLLDCFKYFTKNEVLSDNDLWYCPKCKELKKATKKIDLWLLPKVLIVQLKRFNYTRFWRDKIDLLIDCPLHDLDLSQFVLNPKQKGKAKYDLIAVSNHMGGLGGGHYTAHAKNHNDRRWHTFDDSYVSETSENRIISKAAYVLIYQQK